MTMLTVRESLTYQQGAPRSFFRDLVASKGLHDDEATKRLEQHQREMTVELAKVAAPASELRDGSSVEYRVNPNSALGTGGEFDVPLWLPTMFATAGRAGRPFADALQPMVLPPGCSSIHTPRITPGSLTNMQIDSGAVSSQDIQTVDASSNVITIAGEADISQQLFDMAPVDMDAVFWVDLNRDYNKKVENQLLYGSVGGVQLPNQLLGVSNVTGANTVNGSAMNTVALQWPGIGQVAAAVGNTRLLPPTLMLMAPRRYYYMAFSIDASNRPIGSPTGMYPKVPTMDPLGGADAVDSFGGIPVYLDGAIPAGANSDDLFVLRADDMFLWESAPRTIVAVNPLSGSLQLRLSLHRYVAFIPQRYPTGIGRLSALPQPANY